MGSKPECGQGGHRLGGVLVQPALGDEPAELPPPRLLQHRRVVGRRRDELAVAAERAVRKEYMQRGVAVGERAEALHACDRPGGDVTLVQRRAQVVPQGALGHPTQEPQPPPVVENRHRARTR